MIKKLHLVLLFSFQLNFAQKKFNYVLESNINSYKIVSISVRLWLHSDLW